jgi:hypothetical protein
MYADYLASELPESVNFSKTALASDEDDLRYWAGHVEPVMFFDEILCRRAFDMTPKQICTKLEGTVEKVLIIHGGVYIIGSSANLNPEESVSLRKRIRAALA